MRNCTRMHMHTKTRPRVYEYAQPSLVHKSLICVFHCAQALATEHLSYVGLVAGTAAKHKHVPSSWLVHCLLCDRDTTFRERMRHRRTQWYAK